MRHKWEFLLPHRAECKNCDLIRISVFYPGGRGASAYYRGGYPDGEFIGSRAGSCPGAAAAPEEKR